VKEWLNMPDRPSAEEIVPEIMALVTPLLLKDSRAHATTYPSTDST
jgi:hypothetical protein